MKIISWNVNGIRAVFKKTEDFEKVWKLKPDILAIQETKCEPGQLTKEMLEHNGYTSVFESAKNRKGYSGVAVYTKLPFKLLHATLNKKDFYDEEGRTIVLEFDKFYFLNCYWPNGGKSPEHFLYKLEYYKHFLELAKKLEKKKPVIFCGDINATVADIDLARPKENEGELGCTPEERSVLSKYVKDFTDTFRYINGDKVKYSWWDMKTRSRERNVGWRIDYIFTSNSLQKKIKNAEIKDDLLGSDHCPVVLDIDL